MCYNIQMVGLDSFYFHVCIGKMKVWIHLPYINNSGWCNGAWNRFLPHSGHLSTNYLNATASLNVACNVHLFMTTVYPSSNGYFQQCNAPCLEHDTKITVLTQPPHSPDLNTTEHCWDVLELCSLCTCTSVGDQVVNNICSNIVLICTITCNCFYFFYFIYVKVECSLFTMKQPSDLE